MEKWRKNLDVTWIQINHDYAIITHIRKVRIVLLRHNSTTHNQQKTRAALYTPSPKIFQA